MQDEKLTKTIQNDLRACYTKEELTIIRMTTNKDEYKHLLNAYNITEQGLKSILSDMA